MGAVQWFLLLVGVMVLLVWSRGNNHLDSNAQDSLKTSVERAGADLKSAGRDTATAIRRAVQ